MGADETRARAYADWARSGADASFAPTLAVVLELLPPPPMRVLDIGCGEGRVGRELITRTYEVVGVDVDPTMVALANEGFEARRGDALSLPFADEEFEAALSVYVLMELEEIEPALAEMVRVLAPGGVLVVVIDHPFTSGGRVLRYSESENFRWNVTHDGVDLNLGGVHRSLGAYVGALERSGFRLDTLREIAVGRWDPMSLALRAIKR